MIRVHAPRPKLPTDDKRWKIIDGVMRRFGYETHSLIEVLHTVQEYFGYIDDTALKFVAGSLRVPLSRIYGVVTFYHFFTMKPPGKHTCVVCMGTACYIKGAPQILKKLEEEYGVKAGETTADGELSVLTARCIGSCGLAPAVVVDGEMVGKQTPEATMEMIRKRMSNVS